MQNGQENQSGLAERFTNWVGSIQSLFVHTVLFAGAFVVGLIGGNWDRILLVLTTLVSLEAIYLSIFIQMTVNRHTQSLKDVEEDVEEIAEDVDEMAEELEELHEDVEELSEQD